jgi:phosphoribosylformylglycinamidine synthase subunit PurSL
MMFRIEVGFRPGVTDARGERTARRIRDALHIPVAGVRTRPVYFLRLPLTAEQAVRAAEELFCDPIIQEYALDASLSAAAFDFSVTVGFRPGVTDNVGRTATTALEEVLGVRHGLEDGVSTAVQYLLKGIVREEAERIARELLHNPLIEDAVVQDYADWKANGITWRPAETGGAEPLGGSAAVPAGAEAGSVPTRPLFETVCLEVGDEELSAISARRTLALSLQEMQAIRDYFRRPDVRDRRRTVGLGPDPTDVELEALAQTWSEHCHHKVFNGIIHYEDEHGRRRTIRSLFKSYIRRVTEELARPWLLSVFSDNAGVIRYNDRKALVYKVETHNSPSALDPYGGAMTGIVGVNRDPFGTGMGARLIANVWGYCLGNPFHDGAPARDAPSAAHPRRDPPGGDRGRQPERHPLPARLGAVRRPLHGQAAGLLRHARRDAPGGSGRRRGAAGRRAGRRRAEAAPSGALPPQGGASRRRHRHGRRSHRQGRHPRRDILLGGVARGLAGQAVQIGDPITQRSMFDFLLEARDRGALPGLTDNGAGGLSSSVGEMSELAGGCELDLARAPLKYAGPPALGNPHLRGPGADDSGCAAGENR